MLKKISWHWWVLIGSLILGLALRLVNLGSQPYWSDEILSLDIVRHFSHSLPTMLQYLAEVEVHPPLYYIIMHFWTGWFGYAEAAVKTVSVIFGLGTVVLSFFAAWRMFRSRTAAALAAFLIAVLPMQVEFSQQARPYIIFCFFGVLSLWAFWEYWTSRKVAWLAVYTFGVLAGISLHYSSFFVLGALSTGWLFLIAVFEKHNRSRQFLIWLIVHSVVTVAYYYWLDVLLFRLILGQYDIFGLPRNIYPLRRVDFFEMMTDQVIWLSKSSYISKLEVFLKFIAKVVMAGVIFGATRKILAVSDGEDRRNQVAMVFLAWLFFATLTIFMFSPYAIPYSNLYHRHIIFATIPLVLISSFALSILSRKKAAAALIVFALTITPSVSGVLGNDANWDREYKIGEEAGFINREWRPGDLVITTIGIFRSDLGHYLRPEINPVDFYPINYYSLDFWDSHDTLGFVECEYQGRMSYPPDPEKSLKLKRLFKIYHPKRVWLYNFDKDYESGVHNWFVNNKWRHAYGSVGESVVDLYVAP
jgi:uncharacterized membrane protein